MRACAAIVNLVGMALAQPGHTNYPAPNDWSRLAGVAGGVVANWEPDAAEWWRDGLNGTARSTFQPDVPVDMFAGRPFRLSLQLDEAATSSRQWKVREPLPSVVREVLGVNTLNAGQVHFDLLAADVVPADDSGYLVVGYTHAREWYTQPLAIKLYASEHAVLRQSGTSAPVDDTQMGFSGFFFFLFCFCNLLIIFGVGIHAAWHKDTWNPPPPPPQESAASASQSGGGTGKSSRGAPSTQRAPGSEASFY
jgi:hypothetical protein